MEHIPCRLVFALPRTRVTGRSTADASLRRSASARNLCLAWAVIGLWHGADWTFIAWGLWNAVFLFAEKILRVPGHRLPSLLGRVYALLTVGCGWIIYRVDSISDALTYFANMLAVNYNGIHSDLALALLRENAAPLAAAALFCMPFADLLARKFPDGPRGVWRPLLGLARTVFFLAVLVLCVFYLVHR